MNTNIQNTRQIPEYLNKYRKLNPKEQIKQGDRVIFHDELFPPTDTEIDSFSAVFGETMNAGEKAHFVKEYNDREYYRLIV